jgi:MFS family permease
VGGGFSFVPISIAALGGVSGREAGLASGLINTSQQVGGALGLAVLATVSSTRADRLITNGTGHLAALTAGFSLAFWVGAGVAAVALLTTLLMLKRGDLRAPAEAGIEALPLELEEEIVA